MQPSLKFLLLVLTCFFALVACEPGGDGGGGGGSPSSYSLTVSVSDPSLGIVTATSIDCGNVCNATYPAGTVVTLIPSPLFYGQFTSWSGDAACNSNLAGNNAQITMNADITCVAQFSYTCSPLAQDCPNAGNGCFLNISLFNNACAVPSGFTNLGLQGEECAFLNACEVGYGCSLLNTNTNALNCAHYCDASDPNGALVCGGTESCIAVNQYYSDITSADIPDNIGMCVDCSSGDYTCP